MNRKMNELLQVDSVPMVRLVSQYDGWSQACGPQPEGYSIPRGNPILQAAGEWLFVVVTCEALLLKRILVLRLTFEAKLVHVSNASHVSHVRPCVF